MLISCQHGTEELVSSNICKMENVTKIERTVGLYDLVVEMESNNVEQLRKINSRIKNLNLIHSTLMLVHV